RKTPCTSCHRTLSCIRRCRAPRPASKTNFCSPASTKVLGPNRFMTGGGQPVPRRVTLISCPCAMAGTTVTTKSTTLIIRRKTVATTSLLLPSKPNAGAHLLPEAAARHERTLEAVRCKPLILIEAPSSAYRCGMLSLDNNHAHEEETSCDFTR